MAARNSQQPVEAVVLPTSQKARASQLPVEAVVLPTDAAARASQLPVEVVVLPTDAKVRDSQLVVEVVIATVFPSFTADAVIRTPNRSLTDTLTTLTDSVTRIATHPRTATDTLTTLTDSVVQIHGAVRTASDTLTLSDSLARAAALKTRTLTDTLTSITATVSGTSIKTRTFTADAVIRIPPGLNAFSANAVLRALGATAPLNFKASAIIAGGGGGTYFGGSGPGGGSAGGSGTPVPHPTVRTKMMLDGTDITPKIKWATANFVSTVNGVPGTCSFEVKDLAHTYLPITGKRLDLYIDNFLYWSGYATRAVRVYGFPVDDTRVATKTERLFRIEGVDVNILFQKRVAYNKTTPSKGQLPPPTAYRCSATKPDEWAADVQANVVVPYLLSNFTDLPADGVTFNVSSNFGSPQPDRCFAFTGAMTVGALMTDLNRMLQGVWYIDQNFVFHFHDAETATSLYTLVDDPEKYGNVATNVAPRELTFLSDGSRMINDALVWGTAVGFKNIVFHRATDNVNGPGISSVSDHGLWQYGDFNTAVGKQSTVDKIANSVVFGVTQNQQGARWDRVVITATVYQPLFQLGDVVHCISDAYNGVLASPYDAPFGNKVSTGPLSINVPIRRIEVTFPTPNHAKFQLTLSREIDEPYNAFEFLFPPFSFSFPPIDIPPIDLPPLPSEPCTDCQVGWGTDLGGFSTFQNTSTTVVGSGSHLDITSGGHTGSSLHLVRGLNWNRPTPSTILMEFIVPDVVAVGASSQRLLLGANVTPTTNARGAAFSMSDSFPNRLSVWAGVIQTSGGFTATDHAFFNGVNPGDHFFVKLITTATNQYYVKAWRSDVPETNGTLPTGAPYNAATDVMLCTSTFNQNPPALPFDQANLNQISLLTIGNGFSNVSWNVLRIEFVGGLDCTQLCPPSTCLLTNDFGDWEVTDSFSQEVMHDNAGSHFTIPSPNWVFGYGGGSHVYAAKVGSMAQGDSSNGGNASIELSKEMSNFTPGEQSSLNLPGTWTLPYSFSISSDNNHANGHAEMTISTGFGQSAQIYVDKGDFNGQANTDIHATCIVTNGGNPAGGGIGVFPRGDSGVLSLTFSKSTPGYDPNFRGDVVGTVGGLTFSATNMLGQDPALIHRLQVQVAVSTGNGLMTIPQYLATWRMEAGGLNFTPSSGAPTPWCPELSQSNPFPLNSFGCSSFAPTQIITMTSAFQAGSERVYLNGLIQRPGIDYNTDPPNGQITFTSAPVFTDKVQVCYWSLP